MQPITEQVAALFAANNSEAINHIDVLPPSGSDRRYFRLHTANGNTYIATSNNNVRENETFIYFSEHFARCGAPVPEVLYINDACTLYIQQDLGDTSLLHLLEQQGHSDAVYAHFQKSLQALANMQIRGGAGLNYDRCLTAKEFGKQAIVSDLLYFKYYFLDTLKIPYDKQVLLDDFDALATYLTHTEYKHFMFRDFQSRNIQVKDDKVYFIDYQGGMKGALQYDVASLLWQAKADLPDEWKDSLLQYYLDEIDKVLEQPVDRTTFVSQYNGYVLIRLLQVLGAYGFRGLFERKAHFLTSIPLALRNLKWFLANRTVGIAVTEFTRLLHLVVSDDVIAQFEPLRATAETPLVVKVCSFSYKEGIPADDSGNGGGFVFDCRGILNPGRVEEYKKMTGRDKEVKDYLEQQTRMPDFLNNIYNIVDIAVEDYIRRGFDNLSVSFGCTGGQHRSVYAADALVRHLRNKFGVKIQLSHTVQERKNWIN